MTNKEKIEWLEKELEYLLKMKGEYTFREDLTRREIDRLYDIENKNDNTDL